MSYWRSSLAVFGVMVLALGFSLNVADAGIVSGATFEWASDTTDDGLWQEGVGTFGTNLDRKMLPGGNPATLTINPNEKTLQLVDSFYGFDGTNAMSTVFPNAVAGTDVNKANGGDCLEDTAGGPMLSGLTNATFEIWFRPDTNSTTRQILWETGGGTGTMFGLDNKQLFFRTRSGNKVGQKVVDIDSLIGTGQFVQALATFDRTNNEVELFVNGLSQGGPVTATGNITDWTGGDGDGLGGRGGANLGGFGNGFSQNPPTSTGKGNFGSLDGQIAAFRIYNSKILTAAEALQNFQAVNPEQIYFTNTAGGNTFETGGNWTGGAVPGINQAAMIGNGKTAKVTTTQDVSLVVVGHDQGGVNAGKGTLNINTGSVLTTDGLIVGFGAAANTGTVNQNDGSVTVNGDLAFGASGNTSSLYHIKGGTLHITGSVFPMPGVARGHLYVDALNSLTVDGDTITVQSFRTGNNAGLTGDYTLVAGKTLTTTGSFVMGEKGTGDFTNDGGTLVINDHKLANNDAASVGNFTQNSGSTTVVTNPVELGRKGTGTLTLKGGTYDATSAKLSFGSFATAGGTGTLDIQGGVFTAGKDVTTGATGTGIVNLSGGELNLLGTPATRQITTLNHTGGTLRMNAQGTSIVPLNVTGGATFGAGSLIELQLEGALSWDDANAVTFDGDTSTDWNTDANWDLNVRPAIAAGGVAQGATYDVITTGAGVAGGANLAPVDAANWGVNIVANNVQLERTGAATGVGPVKAIIDTGDVVSANSLRIAKEAGVDATELKTNGGTLTLADGMDLVLGGGAKGNVYQLGGDITVGGDLRYGVDAASAFGGDYHLRGGTLHVKGAVIESDVLVDTAGMFVDGGTLMVDGPTITVQTFRVGQNDNLIGSHTINTGETIHTTGDMYVSNNGTGTLTVNGGTLAVDRQIRMANGGNKGAVGTLAILDGTVTSANGLMSAIGGGANKSTATIQMGLADGSTAPTLTISGANTEIAQSGIGTMNMHGGTLFQDSNNMVISRNGSAVGVLNMDGGTIDLRGTAGTNPGQFNFLNGSGTVNLTGGRIFVGEKMLMTNNANGSASVNVSGTGVLDIGGNIECRANGYDQITISDNGVLSMNSAGRVIFANATDRVNLTGGRLDMNGAAIQVTNTTPTPGNQLNFTGGRLEGLSVFGRSNASGTVAPTSDSTSSITPTFNGLVGDSIGNVDGSALYFAGQNARVNLGDVDMMDKPDAFTTAFWFYRDSNGTDVTNHAVSNVLLAQAHDTTNDNFELGTAGGEFQLYLDMADSAAPATRAHEATVTTSGANLQDDTWYHVAVTYDGNITTGDQVQVYLDGTPLSAAGGVPFFDGAAIGSTLLMDSVTSELALGVSRPGQKNYGDFNGRIDDFGLWTRTLSAAEITTLATDNAASAISSDLLLHLDGSGRVLTANPTMLTQAGGVLAPGDSVGVTTVLGDFELLGGGIYEIEIDGAASNDFLEIDGEATLTDGYLNVLLLDGYVPTEGETFDVMTATSISAGTLGLTSGFSWAILGGGNGDILQLQSIAIASAVPEPSSLMLLMLGALALGLLARNRRPG